MKSKTKKCNTKKHGGMRSTRMKKPPKRLTYEKKSTKKSKRQTKRQTKKTKHKKTRNKIQTKHKQIIIK